MKRLVDLSHRIAPGQVTHPGLPAPRWRAFRSREDYRSSTGTEFQVDEVVMVGNTGTYLDSPFHRFPDGADLAGLPLAAVADLQVVVVDVRDQRAVDAARLAARLGDVPLLGVAVLLHTGGDLAWGTPEYAVDAPFLTADGAGWLATGWGGAVLRRSRRHLRRSTGLRGRACSRLPRRPSAACRPGRPGRP